MTHIPAMNKSDLIKAASRRTGVNTEEVDKVVDAFIEFIGVSLTLGDPVNLRGFGKFEPVHRKPTVRKNPKTGETVNVPAKTAVRFTPSHVLKQRLNGG